MCTRFARRGITGPKNFLEGVYGYFHLFGRDKIDPATAIAGLGSRFELHKVLFKKYPSCGLTLGSTDVVLGLVEEYAIEPAAIDRIVVTVPPYAHKLVGHPFQVGSNPKVNAQFSIAYCVANALLRKCSKLPHFEESAIRDPSILELARKVHVVADAALEARGHTPLDMRVVMLDGRTYERGIDIAPGFPGNPLNKEDHEQRLRDCVAFARKPLPGEKVERIIGAVQSLEKLVDVRSLIPLMLL